MDSNEKILNDLKEIYSYTNYWLNFAELKNGVLVVLNTACIMWVTSLVQKPIFAVAPFLLFSISLVISLLSHFPNLQGFQDLFFFSNSKIEKTDRNLLYFKDIESFTPQEYIQCLYEKYYGEKIMPHKINNKMLNYAEEIIINSKIAIKKYQLFKVALILTILGFIIETVGFVLLLLL